MKKAIIVLIAAFSILAIVLTILMVTILGRGSGEFAIERKGLKLVDSQTISLEKIDDIDIEYHSDDITFYASETNELIIKEYKNYEPEAATEIITSGSKLYIKGRTWNMNSVFNINYYCKVDIYLPASYSNRLSVSTSSGNITSDLILKLKQFKSGSSSGDIYLNEVYADDIKVSASSGTITVQKAEGIRTISASSGDIKVLGGSGDTDISTSSGNITVNNTIGLLEAESSSGEIEITDTDGDKKIESTSGTIRIRNSDGTIKASASSGDITILNSKGAGDIKSNSGNVELELTQVTDHLNIDTSSGDVILKLPASLAFNFTADTSSGDITTFFDKQLSFNKRENHAAGAVGTNPVLNVEISTTSGVIQVKK